MKWAVGSGQWVVVVKGWVYRVIGGQWVGLQGVKGWTYRFPGSQGVGQKGPNGSICWPTGSKGVNG